MKGNVDWRGLETWQRETFPRAAWAASGSSEARARHAGGVGSSDAG